MPISLVIEIHPKKQAKPSLIVFVFSDKVIVLDPGILEKVICHKSKNLSAVLPSPLIS